MVEIKGVVHLPLQKKSKNIYFQSYGKYAYGFEKQWIYGLEWYVYHFLLRTGRLSVVEITTVTITQSEKSHSPESGTCTTLSEES